MAELIELRIEDYRAFRRASLALKSNGLILVAGPNNVGKSALLSAFDVVAGRDAPIQIRHAAGTRVRIWARWQLSEDERRALLGEAPNTNQLLMLGAASWLEWEFDEFQGHVQPVAASVNWSNKERLEFARIEPSGSLSYKLHFATQLLASWDKSSFGDIAGGVGPVETLPHFRNSAVTPPAVDILTQWQQGYFHFQPLREAQGRVAGLNNISPTLQSTGANLATVLLYLQTNNPDIWTQIVTLMQQIVPGVGLLMTPVSGSGCSIVFQDEQVATHQHNIKDLGTGVEQLLMTLVVGLTQKATTLLLEEPETGLHPGAQRALLGLLQDWSRERLFVASTHSATMLDWSSPSTSIFAVGRNGIESTVTLVTTERAAVLRELGVQLSDVLSAERILVLEGPTDKDIFEVWFPEVVRNPRVVILPGRGGYNAQHADLFAEWLDSADELGQRRVLYIRDRDELSAKFLERPEKSPNVYVLPGRELENLLLDFEAATAVINAERVRIGHAAITADNVASSARELADELKPIVVLKRVMADLADPIRLVDNELRRKLSKARADESTLTREVLKRLPGQSTVKADIATSWGSHSRELEATWEQDWLSLVPGADLLMALWMKFLRQGYSKSRDGLAIASAMQAPPEVLSDLLTEFMSDEGAE